VSAKKPVSYMIERNSIHHHHGVETLYSGSETCRDCREMELYDILTAAAVLLLFIFIYRIKKRANK